MEAWNTTTSWKGMMRQHPRSQVFFCKYSATLWFGGRGGTFPKCSPRALIPFTRPTRGNTTSRLSRAPAGSAAPLPCHRVGRDSKSVQLKKHLLFIKRGLIRKSPHKQKLKERKKPKPKRKKANWQLAHEGRESGAGRGLYWASCSEQKLSCPCSRI